MIVAGGFDPGINPAAFGIVRRIGQTFRILEAITIRTSTDDDDRVRIAEIAIAIDRPLERHSVEWFGIERQDLAWHGKSERGESSHRSLICHYIAGVAEGVAISQGAGVVSVTPSQVKSALTGSSKATKAQVKAAVQKLPGCPKRISNHACDAVAAAVFTLRHAARQAIINGGRR